MCTLGGAAATAKGIGTIGDGHYEISEGYVGRFGVFFPFLLVMHPAGTVKRRSIGLWSWRRTTFEVVAIRGLFWKEPFFLSTPFCSTPTRCLYNAR